MSPDWSAKAMPVPYAKLGNPQSLNLFAYTGNNPLDHSDADGHEWRWGGAESEAHAGALLAAFAVDYMKNGRFQSNFDAVASSKSYVLIFGDHDYNTPGFSGGEVKTFYHTDGALPNYATGGVDVGADLRTSITGINRQILHEGSHGGDWATDAAATAADVQANGDDSASEIRANAAETDDSVSPRPMTFGEALRAVESAFKRNLQDVNPVPIVQFEVPSHIPEEH